jgi:hypothetical protein
MAEEQRVPSKELHRYLSAGRVQDDQVSEPVEVASGSAMLGGRSRSSRRAPPYPDGVTWTRCSTATASSSWVRLIVDQRRLNMGRVFPCGIPFPDWFAAEIELC